MDAVFGMIAGGVSTMAFVILFDFFLKRFIAKQSQEPFKPTSQFGYSNSYKWFSVGFALFVFVVLFFLFTAEESAAGALFYMKFLFLFVAIAYTYNLVVDAFTTAFALDPVQISKKSLWGVVTLKWDEVDSLNLSLSHRSVYLKAGTKKIEVKLSVDGSVDVLRHIRRKVNPNVLEGNVDLIDQLTGY